MEQTQRVIRMSVERALAIITVHETELGALDAHAGDGDHGSTMVRGLRAANEAVAAADDDQSPGQLLMTAGNAFSNAAGGASGALYGMFMLTVGQRLGNGPFNTLSVHDALAAGLETISRLGKAKPGDKTMVDALSPFVSALGRAGERGAGLAKAWNEALPAAEAGAESTAQMMAKRGRSARLGERSIGHVDPGAQSMVYLLQAVGEALAGVDLDE